MYNDITAGLRVPSQSPLDIKLYVLTYAELETLGASDFKAFTYYKGITIYCAENEKFYRWRNPVNGSEVGVLASNYTYPAGAVSFGIDYSGQVYNLFPLLETDDLAIENVGTGVQWYQGFAIVGGVKYFNFRTFRAIDSDNPDGVSLINSLTQTADENILELAKIISSNLIIEKIEGIIHINTPVSESNLAFYVDVNSLSSSENGTLASPFKTLNKALDTFIGTGTWYNPQYKGYKITLLSNCTLLETAGADYNGYVNLDINNLDIEGNGFYMSLNANPSPDYYPISTRRMVVDMPKTANVLDYSVVLTFKNVSIHRVGTNAVIDHLNYAFPTINSNTDPLSPQQPISEITLTNVIISNETNVNEASNPDWNILTGSFYFGAQIYVSNTAPIGVPMLKTEGRSWNKEGYLSMNNVSLENSTGTNFKASNTTLQIDGRTVMNKRNWLRYYDTVVDDYYSPKTGLYYIEVDDNTNFCEFQELVVGITIPSLLSTEIQPRRIQIGGSESMMKITNNSTVAVRKGRTEEQYWNTFSFDGTSFPKLDNFEDYSHSEETHGKYKVIAPLPITAISLDVFNYTGYGVITDETGVDKSYIQYLNGYNNTINNAPHSTYTSYPDDTTAKAAGLIRGNIYYNSTIGALTSIL